LKHQVAEWLTRRITKDSFDRKLGQIVCFIAAIPVFALSMWKLTRLHLGEAEFFLGTLLTIALTLLFIILGVLLPIASAVQHQGSDRQSS